MIFWTLRRGHISHLLLLLLSVNLDFSLSFLSLHPSVLGPLHHRRPTGLIQISLSLSWRTSGLFLSFLEWDELRRFSSRPDGPSMTSWKKWTACREIHSHSLTRYEQRCETTMTRHRPSHFLFLSLFVKSPLFIRPSLSLAYWLVRPCVFLEREFFERKESMDGWMDDECLHVHACMVVRFSPSSIDSPIVFVG